EPADDSSPRYDYPALSAVSSSRGGNLRYAAIIFSASGASSSRTRMTVPPTPGNAFCTASMDFKSDSMPADSSNPCTTMASFSCSASKILTSFSLGSGCGAVLFGSGMRPPQDCLVTDYGSHYGSVLRITKVYGQGKLDSRAKTGTMATGAHRGGRGQHPNPKRTGDIWKFNGPNHQAENTTSAWRKPEGCGACR